MIIEVRVVPTQAERDARRLDELWATMHVRFESTVDSLEERFRTLGFVKP